MKNTSKRSRSTGRDAGKMATRILALILAVLMIGGGAVYTVISVLSSLAV